MSPIHFKSGDKDSGDRIRLTTHRLPIFVWEHAEGEQPLKGFCFLSEITSAGAGAFIERKLQTASPVRIALETEAGSTYRAYVVWSNRFAMRQNFFGHDAMAYRVGLKFQFVSEAERKRYLKYIEGLKKTALSVEPGIKF